MMHQLELSLEAKRVAKLTASTHRAAILSYLKIRRPNDGATDDELQTMLGLDGSTERPRRGELVKDGLVKDSGRTRRTRSGNRATVWVAI